MSRSYSGLPLACGMLVACGVLVASVLVRPLDAQPRAAKPFVALAALVQSAPTTTESGLRLSTGWPIHVAPGLALLPSVELARTAVLTTVDRCDVVSGSTTCFARPSHETLGGLSLAVAIAPPHTSGWHPRTMLGAAWLRSSGEGVAGQRRQFLTPDVSVGVAKHSWAVDLRLRRLDRWRASAHAQLALQMSRGF